MIAYLPEFYDDEILYSYLARFQKHTMVDFWTMCYMMFGKSNNRISMYHIDGITKMIDSISHLWKTNFAEILTDHTFFPFFSRFVSCDRRQKMLASLVSGDKTYLVKTKTTVLEKFKYCPICFEDDLAKYGETYWHREHNIPCISVCPDHNCYLNDWSPDSSLCRRKLFAAPMTLPCGVRLNTQPLLLNISKRLSSYLQSSGETDVRVILEKAKSIGLVGSTKKRQLAVNKLELINEEQCTADESSIQLRIISNTVLKVNLRSRVMSGLYPWQVAVLEELILLHSSNGSPAKLEFGTAT